MPLGSFDEPLDHVLAFFLNCYHIKDWLISGPQWLDETDPEIKRRAVEQFVTDSEELKICADLCNGTKHFHFDRKLRSEKPTTFRSTHTKIDLSHAKPIKTIRYTFRTPRGDDDAYALAEQCLNAWRDFIWGSTAESLRALASRNPPSGARRKKKQNS